MQYLVTVVAEDGGGRAGTGTVSIYVDDDNDMAPVFKKKVFRKTMSEGEPSGNKLARHGDTRFSLLMIRRVWKHCVS